MFLNLPALGKAFRVWLHPAPASPAGVQQVSRYSHSGPFVVSWLYLWRLGGLLVPSWWWLGGLFVLCCCRGAHLLVSGPAVSWSWLLSSWSPCSAWAVPWHICRRPLVATHVLPKQLKHVCMSRWSRLSGTNGLLLVWSSFTVWGSPLAIFGGFVGM